MKTADFDFHLPRSLIAYFPCPERDGARLLVLGKDGSTKHGRFSELPAYMKKGDMLILNNTKVFPAKLTGVKPTGGRLEIVLVRDLGGGAWEVLSKKKYTGMLRISSSLRAEIKDGHTAELRAEGDLPDILRREGQMPLPPYIRRKPDETDKERYQTVYAEAEGSIAAPTAGLHFTQRLLRELKADGVLLRYLTLHVGKGTFTPIGAEDVRKHRMEEEYFEMDEGIMDDIEEVKAKGGRVFAVGTTTTRALEGVATGRFRPVDSSNCRLRGATDIFIYPGYKFKAVDCLITNFHLPRSTPLMLTGALAGWENLKSAYDEAVEAGYRFFSYGDAMLIL